MYKEVVLSTSLKENTINVWDVNSCTNLFEFKENFGIRNGNDVDWIVIVGTALVNVPNRDSDYGTFYQSIYSIQVSMQKRIIDLVNKTNDSLLEIWQALTHIQKFHWRACIHYY